MNFKNTIFTLIFLLLLTSCAIENENYSNLDELRDTTDNEIQAELIYTSANHPKQDTCLRMRYKYTTAGDTILIRQELQIYELGDDEFYWDREDRLLRNFRADKHIILDTSYYWSEIDEKNLIPQEYQLVKENKIEKIVYKMEIKTNRRLSKYNLDSFAAIYIKDIDNFLNKQAILNTNLVIENKETGDSSEVLLHINEKVNARKPFFVQISYSYFTKS